MAKADTQMELNKDLANVVSRKYFGTIIGVITFLSLVFVIAQVKQLQILSNSLILPGAALFVFIILPLRLPSVAITILHYLFIFGVSSIPAGFIGSLLISTKKSVGIRVLVIYLLYLLLVAILIYFIVGDFNFYSNI